MTHADPGIAHRETDADPGSIVFDNLGGENDFSLLGEFDRIIRQIDEDLTQTQGIPDQGGREAGRRGKKDLQSLFVGLEGDHVGNIIQDFVQLKINAFKGQFPGLDLGKVEDVVDDAEKRMR